ncbi:MAG TPA: DeoR/GlpR family DNA-binding transcription regulator [Marisediminicola sp.]|jgi:DeoR family fructose operon transcriptional repressor|nr:DeoR/GlpR transcriptional regulator [Cryobacterium sp.]HEV7955715.1 DeoR/GlpR family DNA-binding transcription regulator [Marisediminicola sp.]
MATSGTLGAEERRAWIMTRIEQEGALRLDAAAAGLRVSAMTVRRDLDDLEGEGLVRRVRGGAVLALGPRPFSERRTVNSRAKQVIAHKALALIPSDGAVALDASTTSGTLGSALSGTLDVTVATNSHENFAALRGTSGVTPVLVGGELEGRTGSFVGLIACQAASSMLYRRFFTSASAVDAAHGASEVSLAETQVKHAFGGASREVVLCVDSSKLGRQSVSLSFPLAGISVMITELDPRDSRLDPYRELVELL